MLKTRVLTAVLLLAVFLPSLFFLPQRPWALLTAVVAGVAAWEWAGLSRSGSGRRLGYGVFVSLLCTGATFLLPALVAPGWARSTTALAVHAVAVLFWAALVPFWLARKWQLAASGVAPLLGLVVIVPAWLSLVQLRTPGPGVLLAVLAAVWIADIAAYFSGKAFGRHKLAPAISPGKTWEGAIGAACAVLAYGLGLRWLFGIDAPAIAWWLVGLVAITAVSIVGDLFESLLKRQAGLKDSSNILPGHGGVLDRIDSLTSTLPAVALLWLLLSVSPA